MSPITCKAATPGRRKQYRQAERKKNAMAIETVQERDSQRPKHQAAVAPESPMIIRSPYPDVEVPEVSLPEFVLEQAEARGDAPALINGLTGRTLTYRELAATIRQVAAGFQAHGVVKGDVLALCSPNGIEFVITYFAAASAGAVITTMNPATTNHDIVNQLTGARASFLVTTPELFEEKGRQAAAEVGIRESFVFGEADGATRFASLLETVQPSSPIDLSPDDLVLLPFSSGTSGLPKGVMLTHRQLVSSLCQTIIPHSVQSDDVAVAVLPLFHIYGMQVTMNLTLRAGATLVLLPRFDLETFLRVVEAYRVTRAELVPPIVLALAKQPVVDRYDLSSLRVITAAAAPLGGELAQACAARLGCTVKQAFGMTELGGGTHFAPDTGRDDPESVGPAQPGVESRIVDTLTGEDVPRGERGELLIRTPAAMRGYLNNPEATAATIDADGWVHTGDIVTVDKDGWFRVVDRVKELIKYKGFQVAPAELEGILLTHPCVADCAVVGSPDLEAGEIPKAYVVLRSACTSVELLDWVAQRVAPYKKIRRLEFVERIPKNPSGKILRRVLREAEHAARGQTLTGARQ
jgi:acyl-CoA synthetase (AMP-forming)/AMP-acid ligase II